MNNQDRVPAKDTQDQHLIISGRDENMAVMTLILYVVLLAYVYVFACQSPWRELRNVKGVVSEGVDCNRGVVLHTGKAFDNCLKNAITLQGQYFLNSF